jgi:hypothetical protein
VLNVNKLKLFLQEKMSETDSNLLDLNFHDYHTDGSITRARARLINYKNVVHLALLMLNEEGGLNIDSALHATLKMIISKKFTTTKFHTKMPNYL